jgi:hypothetical protein
VRWWYSRLQRSDRGCGGGTWEVEHRVSRVRFGWFPLNCVIQLINKHPLKGFDGVLRGEVASRSDRDKFLGLLAFGNILAADLRGFRPRRSSSDDHVHCAFHL